MPVTADGPILRTEKVAVRVDPVAAFRQALGLPGQSALRLARRIWRSRFSARTVTVEEFFRYGMHRPSLTEADCAAFLSVTAVTRFNRLLNGPRSGNEALLLNDKLRTAAMLEAAGLPVAKVRAVFPGPMGQTTGEVLDTAEAVAAFLLRPGSTPCFGKPVFGAFSKGVVLVERPAGEGRLLLGNGKIVEAARLAGEIATHYRRGYVFQDLLRAGEGIRALSGPVMPTLRVYSLWVGGGPRLMYAALRLPAPGAMADDGGVGRNIRLHVDLATGAVLRGQDMTRFAGSDAEKSAVTGLPLKGFQLPDWEATLDLSRAVHAQFPRHRSVGIDLALSDRGLVVNEVNAGPQHLTYQVASLQGILNPGFTPLFREALAERGVTEPKPGVPWPG